MKRTKNSSFRIPPSILFLILWNFPFFTSLVAQPSIQLDSIKGMEILESAVALDKEGRYFEAIPVYEKSLPLFKNGKHWYFYFKARIGIAYDYLDGNKYQDAKQYIDQVIAEFESIPISETPFAKYGDAWLCKGNIHNVLFEFQPAISSFEKALAAYQSLPDDDEMKDKGSTFAYNNLGSVNLKARNFSKALEYLTHALEYKKKVFGPAHQRTLNSMYLISETWSQMGFLNKALELQKEILEVEKSDGEEDGIAHCYREMSKIYQHKKDFKTAEEYIRRAIDFYENSTARTLYKTAICEHQMGNVLKDGGQYEASIPWFEKAIEKHNKIHGGKNYDSGLSIMNIGKALAYMEHFEEALDVYQKATENFKSSVSNDNPRYVELWTSMGVCNFQKGDKEEAHRHFSKSYHLAKNVMPERTYDRAQACYHLSKTTESIEQSLALCQEGLFEVSADFSAQDLFDNPSIESIFHEQVALILFEQKINLLIKGYEKNNDINYLKKGLETVDVASKLVDLVRQSFYTESAKTDLAAEARKIYEAGTIITFFLQETQPNPIYLEQAFQFMEKSRSLVLLEDLHRETANQMVKIPDSLAFRSEVLKKEILLLETQFQLSEKDQVKAQKINEQLFSAKEKYLELEKNIEENYPEITRLKGKLENVSLTEIQQKLRTGEVVLEYLITPNELFLLKINSRQKELSKTTLPEEFQTDIIEFIQLLKEPRLAADSGLDLSTYLNFTQRSRAIFEILIGDKLKENNHQILFIPDQYLSFLPFELLLTNDNFSKKDVDYSTLPYLIVNHPVRYAFSANLQFKSPSVGKKHNDKLLAFAPEYSGSANPELATREGFSALTQTVKEVEEIKTLVNGSTVTGKEANEKTFKENAAEYGILHLAMHAFTDEENPMISGLIFSENNDGDDDVLRTYELQGMKLNAQLAVLSACNTGSGKLEKGEGIMSLGRGFRRAGVPNILMSLWQVDDESTRQIMRGFYTHLKNGKSTDEALRQAKLDYLETGRKNYPFYWSAFIFMGEHDGLDFVHTNSSPLPMLGYGVVTLILAACFWVIWKRKKSAVNFNS